MATRSCPAAGCAVEEAAPWVREDQAVRWSLVVPVKRLSLAKTRLALTAEDRADLALAMALDVVDAGIACPSVTLVIVVSDDERAAAELTALGADVVEDEPDAGLNPALAHGVATAVMRAPGDGVMIVSSDVPTMTAEELTSVVTAAAGAVRSFVRDAAGTGTTLLAARDGADLVPRFGPQSGEQHAAAGHTELDVTAPGVRRDIDTVEDLQAALAAADPSAAPRTRTVARRLGLFAD
jgi:2-phospho-L-lactate guanylyltransferase